MYYYQHFIVQEPERQKKGNGPKSHSWSKRAPRETQKSDSRTVLSLLPVYVQVPVSPEGRWRDRERGRRGEVSRGQH